MLVCMANRDQSPLTRATASVLSGYVRRAGLRQADIAERTGISMTVIQRKLSGNAPIDVDDLAAITRAIGLESVTPQRVFAEAEDFEAEMSSGSRKNNVNDIEEARRRGTLATAAAPIDEESLHDE